MEAPRRFPDPRTRPARLLSATLALAATVVLAGPGPAAAQEAEASSDGIDLEALNTDRRNKARKYPLDRRVSRYLSAAAELLDAKKADEAEDLLLRLEGSRITPYDQAYIYRMLGVVAYSSEQPAKSIGYFTKVLELEMLPIRDEAKMRFSIAQLHAQLEEWPKVVAGIEDWERYVESPDPAAIYLKALAYYQMGEVQSAIENVKRAIELSPEPRENWMRMLYALYTQIEDFERALPLLEELLISFPKKEYWVQLSLIYQAREEFDASLAAQQVAHAQGYLVEDKELRRLARSYLYHELPYPAAEVMERGLESGAIEEDVEAYRLLADALVAAREYDRSLEPLRKAAELSEDGTFFARLGQVYMQREDWEQAVAALERALQKGGLRREGNTLLLMGIASYNASKLGDAQRYFAQATRFEDTRSDAATWIDHLAKENEGAQDGESGSL